MLLDKQFDYLKLEKSIYSKWELSGSFKPQKNKESYWGLLRP